MTREEREQMIERLQAENAESLLEIARREERSVADENAACDELLARCAQRRQTSSSAGELVVKEFPVSRQLPPPELPLPMLATQNWVADVVVTTVGDETFKIIAALRAQLRKEFATEIGELRAELELLRSLAKSAGKTKRRS
jgi:hypothetical protein